MTEPHLAEAVRSIAQELAAIIRASPSEWTDAAEWLKTHPCSHGARFRWDDMPPGPEDGDDWIHAPSEGMYARNDETTDNRLRGPIFRTITDAWHALSHRYMGTEGFRDLTTEGAKQIAFLGAITFDPDFDGPGLDWPWLRPDSAAAALEGRRDSQLALESALPTLLRLLEAASSRVTANGLMEKPTVSSPGDAPVALNRSVSPVGVRPKTWQAVRKQAEALVRGAKGKMPSDRSMAARIGCSAMTVAKAIKRSTYLTARKAEQRGSRSARTVPLTEAHTASDLANSAELDRLVEQQATDDRRDRRVARKRRV